jgi:putative restriction endonuclease
LKFFVAITDFDWFQFLASQGAIEEVNFWQPSAHTRFMALQPGGPFLFKLHSPRNYIVGGGFFSYYTSLPVSFAWGAFGEKNGAHSENEMRARIEKYRRLTTATTRDGEIGCILLQAPFFFTENEWIPVSDWAPSIVRGRGYDTAEMRGQEIWQQVEERLKFRNVANHGIPNPVLQDDRFGEPQIVLPRLGQGLFRVKVADAYDRKCAFTRSPVLPILEAAHIKPFADHGPHEVNNGILLRQDVHTLFDRGYITITPSFHVEVSRQIKNEFNNGHEYYSAHGQTIALPEDERFYPAKDYLQWHNENRYIG